MSCPPRCPVASMTHHSQIGRPTPPSHIGIPAPPSAHHRPGHHSRPGIPDPPRHHHSGHPGHHSSEHHSVGHGHHASGHHDSGHHQHHFVPGRDDLADHVMEDMGDAGIWNEASAMSLTDFERSETEDEDTCPPCEEPERDESHHSGRGHHSHEGRGRSHHESRGSEHHESRGRQHHEGQGRFHHEGNAGPQFHSTQREQSHHISRESAPTFHDPSSEVGECTPCEDASAGMHSSHNESGREEHDLSALIHAPSNVSVFDAEELNITTAPRNADWEIPRNRIWQTLTSSLDETEKLEEDEYLEFVSGIQHRRREFFEDED